MVVCAALKTACRKGQTTGRMLLACFLAHRLETLRQGKEYYAVGVLGFGSWGHIGGLLGASRSGAAACSAGQPGSLV
jgi:hypothetical protein